MANPQDENEHVEPSDEGPERYWRPLVEEESLRPMILAVALALMTMGGWAILLAVRDRHPVALLFGLLLGVLSGEAIFRNRRKLGRFGIITWVITALWLGSAVAAWAWSTSGYI